MFPPKPKLKSIGFGYGFTIFVEFSVVESNMLFCFVPRDLPISSVGFILPIFYDSELFLSVSLFFGFSESVEVNFGVLNIPPAVAVPDVCPLTFEVPNVVPNIDPAVFEPPNVAPNIDPAVFEPPNVVPNVGPLTFEDPNVFEPIGEVVLIFGGFVLLNMVFPAKVVFPNKLDWVCGGLLMRVSYFLAKMEL